MAGSGHNHQQIKYSYFHCNSPVLPTKTPSACASTTQDQPMTNSSTSPWYYHPAALSGDKDDLTVSGELQTPIETGTMFKPPSSTSLSPDGSTTNAQLQENNGHFFVKKTFHKPTYCHHCVEMLWGLIGQGYYCEGTDTSWRTTESIVMISLFCFSMQFHLSWSVSKIRSLAMFQYCPHTDQSEGDNCRTSSYHGLLLSSR